jgi:translation initiation factor 4A
MELSLTFTDLFPQSLKISFFSNTDTMSSSAMISSTTTSKSDDFEHTSTASDAASGGAGGPSDATATATASAVTTDDAPTAELKKYTSFDDMELPDSLLRGVYSYGFERPSEIQTMAIVPMRDRRDLLAQAQSGTGKTGTFIIGGLCNIDTSLNEVQMVVLCPTRELADQTTEVSKGIGEFMKLRVHTLTGGTSVSEDLAILNQSKIGPPHVPHLLVATPGRLYDLLHRKAVNPKTIRVLILDEADQMLEARFREQVHCILGMGWSEKTQVALLSATMIPEITVVAKSLLNNPVTILLDPDDVTLDGIKQWYVKVDRDEYKLDTLCDIWEHLSIQQATIFVNTRARAEWLGEQMRGRGFDLDFIHGDMSVSERKSRMQDFRSGKCRVLISTDLIARGIDVQQISVVINFELPVQRENYIHRIGRSGRYGRKGASINMVTEREMRAQAEIESFYGTKINVLPLDLNIY